MAENKLEEARRLRNKARQAKAAESNIRVTKMPRSMGAIGETPMDPAKVKYDKLNPKPAISSKFRYQQPLTPSPEGGKTVTPVKEAAKNIRQKALHMRGLEAQAPKPGQLTESPLKYQAKHLTNRGKTVTPKGFHELGIRAEKAKAFVAPKVAKGPSQIGSIASKVGKALTPTKWNPLEGIKDVPGKWKAAGETAKAAKWYNPVGKLSQAGVAGRTLGRLVGRAATPIMLADTVATTGSKMLEAGKEQLKAESALQDFKNTASKYRKLGITTQISEGAASKHTALLTGGPKISVNVPNEDLAMRIARKRIPKGNHINYKKSLSDMSMEELSQVEVKRKK